MNIWIRVSRNKEGNIIALYSPDLEMQLIKDDETVPAGTKDGDIDFREKVRIIISAHIAQHQPHLIPKRLTDLKKIPLSPLEHWERFEIDVKDSRKYCSKALPRMGHFFNVLTHLSGVFITFMALRIASNQKQEESGDTDDTSMALSIIGAAFNSSILFVVYVFSGTSDSLRKIGHNLDRFLACKITNFFSTIKKNRKFISLTIAAMISTLTANFITATRLYQEQTLLTEKYLKLDPDLNEDQFKFRYDLIKWLVVMTYVVSGGYCSIAFQGNFAMKLVNYLAPKKPQDRMPLSEIEATAHASIDLDVRQTEQTKLLKDSQKQTLSDSFDNKQPATLHFSYTTASERTERKQSETASLSEKPRATQASKFPHIRCNPCTIL